MLSQANPCRAPTPSAKNWALRSAADNRMVSAWTGRAADGDEVSDYPGMPGSVSMLPDSVRAEMIPTSGVNGHQSEVSGAVPVLSDSVSIGMIPTSEVSGSASGLSGPASGGRGSESQRCGSAESQWPLPEFSLSPSAGSWRLRLARSALRSTTSAIVSLASSVELATAPRFNGTRLASA